MAHDSFDVPGLGQHEDGLSLLCQWPGQQGGDFRWSLLIDAPPSCRGPILVLQDTTEFTSQRERADQIGVMHLLKCGKDKYGGRKMHTVCGLLMHSSLAMTLEGLPLGLSPIKFWTRLTFKGTAALKKISLCRDCACGFNEPSGTVFNRLQYPTDVICLVVLWRLCYKLSSRDPVEMFALRGLVFTHEAARA